MASCTDFVQNGGETGIDCGGTCWQRCEIGAFCNTDLDCETAFCGDKTCATFARALNSASAGNSDASIKNEDMQVTINSVYVLGGFLTLCFVAFIIQHALVRWSYSPLSFDDDNVELPLFDDRAGIDEDDI